MIKSIFLILLPLYVISATLTLNVVRDNNRTYSILHLEDNEKIRCSKEMNSDFKDQLICHFTNPLTKRHQPLENRYFNIDFFTNKIVVTAKYNFEYYPLKKTFIKDDTIDSYKATAYRHWIVIGFKGESTLYGKRENIGLSFPVTFKKSPLPMVGELDFDLNPIEKTQDAKSLVKIKKYYHDKKYEKALKEVNYILEEKPTLFHNEAKLYKIRILDKMLNTKESRAVDDGLDPQEIIDLADAWIADNPSNIHIPEMYMYIAKTYLKLGRASKAQKYLDILENEYKNRRYNYLAKLANADRIYKVKNKNDAMKIYKEILYNTDDFDIASMAALRLTEAYIDKKKIPTAKQYILKILKANKPFITTHSEQTYKLAKTFAENNESNISLEIATLLEHHLKDKELDEDELKKNIAYWYEKSKKNDKAIALYKQYLDEEKYGKYRDFVSERLDKIMLNTDEKNTTKKLAYLETIMIRYKDDAIYAKALLAKAELLLKNGNYQKILEMKEPLRAHGGKALLNEVANKALFDAYHDKRCQEAISLETEYNLTVRPTPESVAFDCYVQKSLYDKALRIAKEHTKDKQLQEKLKWTYKSAKLYSKLGRYKATILAADDVEKLQELVKTTEYNDIIYDKIEAYYQLGDYDALMLREVQRCEKLFPKNVRNLDVFEKILNYAKKKRDTSLIINYAKKMIELQERYKIDTYTPKVQLDYINALRDKKRFKLALDETLKLLYKKLNDTQRAHVLYLAGDLSEKFDKIKEAKEFYTKCGEIVENSAWVELCSENLQLLEDR